MGDFLLYPQNCLPEVSKLHCHLYKRIWTAIATFHQSFAENLETENLNVRVLVKSGKKILYNNINFVVVIDFESSF